MKGKTLICSYGKGIPVEQIFEHLRALYLTNYSSDYVWGVLIDLPDSDLYRIAGDSVIEDRARECLLEIKRECVGDFFCGVRQRRREYEGYRFLCENGARGALEALWRQVKGNGSPIYPIYEAGVLEGVENIYFTRAEKEDSVTVIEPGGLFRLAARLTESDAVFAPTCALKGDFRGDFRYFNGFETLYSARALEKMLFCEASEILPICANEVGFCSINRKYLHLVKGGAL